VTNYGGDLNLGNNTQTRIGIQRFTIDWINDANKSFGSENQFQLNVSAGFQAIATRSDNVGATGQGFVTNSANVITNASTTSANQQRSDVRQYGWLSQVQLGFRDRIFLQAGARLDDFSAFGQATDAILLPKVGLSWVLSDEKWFPQTSLLSSFRGRTAYGTTGRAPGAGAALQTLQAAPYASQVGTADRHRGRRRAAQPRQQAPQARARSGVRSGLRRVAPPIARAWSSPISTRRRST
jgi:hypothetical protein